MHVLEAAAAVALLDRQPAQRISEVSHAVREETGGLARLALALVAVVALFVTLDVAGRASSPEAGPKVAIERSN